MILEKTYDGAKKYSPYVRTWLGWAHLSSKGKWSVLDSVFDTPWWFSERSGAISCIKAREDRRFKAVYKKTYFTKLDEMK